MKASEEIPDACEEVDKSVITCSYANGSLLYQVTRMVYMRNGWERETYYKENIDADKDCFCRLEWYLVGKA